MSSLSKSSSSEDDAHDHHHAELRRGPWTLEEDTLLDHYIALHGEGRWNLLSKRAGLHRTGKSCRLRWLNYLKPEVKRGNLTPQEQILILDLHSKLGNRWSKIAQHLPGRTDNEIKNYWRTRVQKQAKHLKIDANSTAFQEIVRCFWMPTLLQKIEGSTSSSSTSSAILSHNSTASQPVNNYVPDHNLPEQGSNSSISSTDQSMDISQISQLSEYQQTSPNNVNSDCYYVDSSTCYEMETENLGTMSPSGGVGNCHMAEGYWVGCDFGDNDYMWSMEDFMAI